MSIKYKFKKLYTHVKLKVKSFCEDIQDLLTSCVSIDNEDAVDIDHVIDSFAENFKHGISVVSADLKHETKALGDFLDDLDGIL